jgi:hypothetical protein
MLNLSAGEGRDTSAFGTTRIDWSRPLVGAILHALQIGIGPDSGSVESLVVLRRHDDFAARCVGWMAGQGDLVAKDGRLRRMSGTTS